MYRLLKITALPTCLTILFLIFFTGSDAVQAQKKPIAIQSGVSLSPTNRAAYERAAADYAANKTTQNRDRLVFMAIAEIDVNFGYYQKNRRYKNNLFQTVMDILEVGAATAISITNGARPKSLIADGLGFIQGARAKVNKNLRLLEMQILVNKMVEKRSNILTRILDNTRQYSNDQYPFERAFLDVVAYYEAGTMDSALSALASDTGATAQNAQSQLANAKAQAGIVLAPSADQIRISRENSDVVDAILASWEKADEKEGKAQAKIDAAQKTIDDEQKKPTPDSVVITKATTEKHEAEMEKTGATSAKKKELDRLKAIFSSVAADPELSQLLEGLPQRYPNIAGRIQARLARIRNGTADVEDYGLTILQLLRAVVAVAPDKPSVVVRTKNVLDSVN